MKQKSEALRAFKKFKVVEEKESGREIKASRIDRGGKFTPKEFQEFCKENKIRHPLTIPRSPYRIAWRKEKIEQSLIWPEACSKARNNYQNNFGLKLWRAQSIFLIDLQQEVCGERHHKRHGVEESPISHLRVFGSVAHVHIADERSTKLDDKSESFVFIGYDSSSKG